MTTNLPTHEPKGTTTDITVCELCGRDNLRKTVVLALLDSEGAATGDVVHYGTECAARVLGCTKGEVRGVIKAAQLQREIDRCRAEEFLKVYGPLETAPIEQVTDAVMRRHPCMDYGTERFRQRRAARLVADRLAEAREILARL